MRWRLSANLIPWVALAAGCGWSSADEAGADDRRAELPTTGDVGPFVSQTTCAVCHPGEAESHRRTYHRTMTQEATPEAVLGSFVGQRLDDRGRAFVFRRDGEVFFADELGAQAGRDLPSDEAPSPGIVSRRIVMTTGSHQQQAYWFRNAEGVLEQLPWVWLVQQGRWIPNPDSFLVDPRIAEHAGSGRWDDNCYRCHSTGWDRREPHPKDHVSVTDLGITCTACHGPGDEHIEANQNPLRRWWLHLRNDGDDTIVHPERLSPSLSSAVCAQCHSESLPRLLPGSDRHLTPFVAGDEHAEHFMAATPMHLSRIATSHAVTRPRIAGAFWPDGTARVGGREYSAMMLSGCFLADAMSCLSCHSMHDADPDKQVHADKLGDAMCTQCHAPIAVNLAAHTHHPESSSGSRCASCHMPRVTYGLLAARPSHRFDSPAVTGATTNERPNACNLCHLDQTLAWTAGHLAAWYNTASPELPAQHHDTAASIVWALSGDAAQRAISAWHLGWPTARAVAGEDWQAPILAELLTDRYAAVRFIAGRSLLGDATTTTATATTAERGAVTGPATAMTMAMATMMAAAPYDFVGPEASRRAIAATVHERWRNTAPAERDAEARRRLLLDARGALDLARLAALVAARDDSPLGIAE